VEHFIKKARVKMAEGKKSFIIYLDSKSMVNKLSNERAGILFKTLFSYCSDENPICDDEVVDMAFEHFKNILKRDLVKYENIVGRNRKNGSNGGRPKNPVGYLETEKNKTQPKKADNDNVNDNVTIKTNIAGVIDFDSCFNICLFDENWKLEVERMYKIDKDKIQYALLEFKTHCATIGENKSKTLNQFKKHFTNWVRIKKQYQVKTENKDKL